MQRPSRNDRRDSSEHYRAFLNRVSAILFAADPIGIAEENPHTDEYEGEARRILARLDEATGPADLGRITHEVFVEMFSEALAAPASKYGEIAKELWPAVQELRMSSPTDGHQRNKEQGTG